MLALLLNLVALLPVWSAQEAGGAVRITVKPQQVFIEQTASGQSLNFDFLIENSTDQRLRISSIRLLVLDANQRLVLRRVLDDHGLSPGIYTIPKLEIEPKGSLYLFNPFHFFDRALELGTLKYEFAFSSANAGTSHMAEALVRPTTYQPKAFLLLPLKGRVIVEAGHDFYSPHRRIDLTHPLAQLVGLKTNSARYASDLTIANEKGELHGGTGDRLEDWFGYGAQIFSPAEGRVLMLVDGVPDNTFKDGAVVFSKALSMDKASGIFGNFLVIDHGQGEYSLFAHLKQGSFRVKSGERVKQGQLLAEIGFSGNTDFVHTHYQLQDNANPAIAEGLPAYFRNFRQILGSRVIKVKEGQINTGNIVERQ